MKHPRALVGLILAAVACGGPAPKPTPTYDNAPPDLQDRIEHGIIPPVLVEGEQIRFALADRMAKYKVPGVSIAVFQDYRVIWAGGYGVTDVETKAPVTETTLFQAGSISKSVNAAAVLITAADGTIKLDAPINDQLRSWKLPDNELTRASPVTVRRLLSHTAGTTVHGFPGYPSGAPVPTLVQVLDGTPPANTPAIRVDLAPGSKFRYSGGGITITQLLLVDLLGKPYPEILAERVLRPLGMTSSTYEQPLPADRLALAASGHHADGTRVPTSRHVYPEMAAAGLWTTPTDLALFFAEVARARAGQSTKLTKALAMQMTTEVDTEAHVGLGVFMTDRNGAPMFGHNGADEGFQALASASMEAGYGVVIMANSDNGFDLFPEIERTVFWAMRWPGADRELVRVALTEANRDRFVGTYVTPEGIPFSLSASGDGLVALRPLAEAEAVIPVSADTLVLPSGLRVTLTDTGDLQLEAPGGGPVVSAPRLAGNVRLPLLELAAGRLDDAVAVWRELLRVDPASPLASEEMHNLYGYRLMQDGRVAQALEVFRAIARVFPQSSNADDSLGEAYMAAGKTAEAITAYEVSIMKLDADPKIPPDQRAARRAHGEEALAKLRAR